MRQADWKFIVFQHERRQGSACDIETFGMNVERFIMSIDDDPAVGRPLLDPRAWEDQERERFDFQNGTLCDRMYFIEWTKNPKEQTSGLKEYDSSGPQRTAPSERQ